MLSRRTLVAATLALGLLAPASAQAETFLPRNKAERATKQIAAQRYAVERPVGAFCTLPDGSEPTPGYSYRRWSCTWAAESQFNYRTCFGVVKVSGFPGWGSYRWSVARGIFGC